MFRFVVRNCSIVYSQCTVLIKSYIYTVLLSVELITLYWIHWLPWCTTDIPYILLRWSWPRLIWKLVFGLQIPNPQFISSNIFFKSTITSPCFLNFSHVFVRDYLLVPILVSFCLYLLLGCWFWWSVYKNRFPVLVLSLLAMLMFPFFKYAFFLRLFDGVVYIIFIAMIFCNNFLMAICSSFANFNIQALYLTKDSALTFMYKIEVILFSFDHFNFPILV